MKAIKKMNVKEYRQLVHNLERIVRVDYQTAVWSREKARVVDMAKSVGSELIHARCARASQELLDDAERAIDWSAGMITKEILGGAL